MSRSSSLRASVFAFIVAAMAGTAEGRDFTADLPPLAAGYVIRAADATDGHPEATTRDVALAVLDIHRRPYQPLVLHAFTRGIQRTHHDSVHDPLPEQLVVASRAVLVAWGLDITTASGQLRAMTDVALLRLGRPGLLDQRLIFDINNLVPYAEQFRGRNRAYHSQLILNMYNMSRGIRHEATRATFMAEFQRRWLEADPHNHWMPAERPPIPRRNPSAARVATRSRH